MLKPYFNKVDIVIFLVLTIFLAAGIILSNLVIVIAFALSSELRRSYTNIIAVNLAISDIFVGVILLPVWVTIIWIENQTIIEKPSQKWNDFITLVSIFNNADLGVLIASTLNLTCLSVERGLMIAAPLWYRKHANRKFVVAFVVTPWICAGLMVALNANSIWQRAPKGYQEVFNFTCGFVIPSIIITFSYSAIAASAMQSKRRIAAQSNRVSHVSRSRREIKLAIKLLLLLLAYFLCWFPYFTLYMILAFDGSQETYRETLLLYNGLKYLSYVNSLLDPFLYIMVRKPFRMAIKQLFRCRNRRLSGSGERMPNVSQVRTDLRQAFSISSAPYGNPTDNSLNVNR